MIVCDIPMWLTCQHGALCFFVWNAMSQFLYDATLQTQALVMCMGVYTTSSWIYEYLALFIPRMYHAIFFIFFCIAIGLSSWLIFHLFFDAMVFQASLCEGGECTVRNRGTECVKSPEMLKLLSTNNGSSHTLPTNISILEGTNVSVGKAGDVWGLGCLLYELLTGEYLLYDDDWVRFFMRVTLTTEVKHHRTKHGKL